MATTVKHYKTTPRQMLCSKAEIWSKTCSNHSRLALLARGALGLVLRICVDCLDIGGLPTNQDSVSLWCFLCLCLFFQSCSETVTPCLVFRVQTCWLKISGFFVAVVWPGPCWSGSGQKMNSWLRWKASYCWSHSSTSVLFCPAVAQCQLGSGRTHRTDCANVDSLHRRGECGI